VRWICRTVSHRTEVRLVDDTGREEPAETKFYPLRQPASPVSLDGATALAGIVVEEPGGLFFARQGEHCDALIVSSSRAASDFHELVVEPELNDVPQDITALLSLIDLWHQARLVGPLADSRRDYIARRLLSRLYDTLCGSRWGRAEDAFFQNPNNSDFQYLERAIGGRGGFALVLRQSPAIMQQGTASGTRWFGEVADRYDVCHEPTLAAFALRVASRPFALGGQTAILLENIQRNDLLMRGARLVALHCIAADQDHPGAYLPRWTW